VKESPHLEEVSFTDAEVEERVVERPEVGWTEVTNIHGRGIDAAAGMTAGLAVLEKTLAALGRQLVDLARVVLYIADMNAFAAINQAYSRHFGLNPPVRVCVAVGRDRLPPGTSSENSSCFFLCQ